MKKFLFLLSFSAAVLTTPAHCSAGSALLAGTVDTARCKGTRTDGQPCRSTIVSKATGYCRAHDPAAIRCGVITGSGKPCKMIVNERGQKCRHHINSK